MRLCSGSWNLKQSRKRLRQRRMRRLNRLRRRRDARNTRRQRRSVLCAAERAQQLLFLSELRFALLCERGFAAIHVHRAAHAALALAKTQRHSGERATKEHEQKEQGCESRFHY